MRTVDMSAIPTGTLTTEVLDTAEYTARCERLRDDARQALAVAERELEWAKGRQEEAERRLGDRIGV